MGLLHTPHYIEHRALLTQKVGSTVAAPGYDAPFGYKCMVQAQSFQATFTATGVEMKRPHKVFIDTCLAGNFKVGDLIDYDGEVFVVTTPFEVRKAFAGLGDYATFFMDDSDGDE